MSCKNCEYWGTDNDRFGWWPVCYHPDFGDDGKTLPNKNFETPKWCPLENGKGEIKWKKNLEKHL